jgi:hypothetical protein
MEGGWGDAEGVGGGEERIIKDFGTIVSGQRVLR